VFDLAHNPNTQQKQALVQKVIAAVFVGAFAILAGLMFQRWAGERAADKALFNEFEGKDYPFELRWVKNKGMGLFATRPIKQGDRIITEKPLFKLTTEGQHRGRCALTLTLTFEYSSRTTGEGAGGTTFKSV